MKTYIYASAGILIGILVGRYILSPKTETKEVVKYITVYEEKKEEKKNKRTTIKEVVRNDGTKETTTVVDESSDTVTNSSNRTDFESSKVKKVRTADLSVSLIAINNLPNPKKDFSYGAVVTVPVVGNLNATGMVTTDKQVGIGIGISF